MFIIRSFVRMSYCCHAGPEHHAISSLVSSTCPSDLYKSGFCHPPPMFIIRSFVRMSYCCHAGPEHHAIRSLVSSICPSNLYTTFLPHIGGVTVSPLSLSVS